MQHKIEIQIGEFIHEISVSVDYVHGLAYWQASIYVDGYPDSVAIVHGQHSSYAMAKNYAIKRCREIASLYAGLYTNEILNDVME